jgi:hypothetical protein
MAPTDPENEMPPTKLTGDKGDKKGNQPNAMQTGKQAKNAMQSGAAPNNGLQKERSKTFYASTPHNAATGGPPSKKKTGDNPKTGKRKGGKGKRPAIGGVRIGAAPRDRDDVETVPYA